MSEKKTETAKAGAVKTAEVKPAETVVYCGPTVRGVAQQFTIFTDGTPEAVKDFCEKYPIAASLVVPLEQFATARAHIAAGTGRESMVLRSLKKQMEG